MFRADSKCINYNFINSILYIRLPASVAIFMQKTVYFKYALSSKLNFRSLCDEVGTISRVKCAVNVFST